MSSSLGANASVNDVRQANSTSDLGGGLVLQSSSLGHCLEPESTADSNAFFSNSSHIF